MTSIKQLNLQQGYALLAKKSHQTGTHRHYGIELILCEQAGFDLFTENGSYLRLNAAIIPSNLPHRFQCGDATCQLLFLDPLSPLGQYVFNRYQLYLRQDIVANPPDIENLFSDFQSLNSLSSAADMNGLRKIDFRIQNCLQQIRANPDCAKLSVRQLTEVSFLSESRLSHLFKQQLGVSIRQFILWNRIGLAVSKSNDGHSLTTAALYAGFSDSSHFCRAFSDMFGSSPFHTLKS
ncbi:AraC family transcriptional regulator [Pedobacter heparinus]|uniref:helix-turn-helix domain-containing protein n=1 Tax=Pedobacter heparinus TaxID=984 RepID=UPI00292E1F3A|nr:AraC family transcriptional regulator [Pedobacter heparinus]